MYASKSLARHAASQFIVMFSSLVCLQASFKDIPKLACFITSGRTTWIDSAHTEASDIGRALIKKSTPDHNRLQSSFVLEQRCKKHNDLTSIRKNIAYRPQ